MTRTGEEHHEFFTSLFFIGFDEIPSPALNGTKARSSPCLMRIAQASDR